MVVDDWNVVQLNVILRPLQSCSRPTSSVGSGVVNASNHFRINRLSEMNYNIFTTNNKPKYNAE